MSYTRKCGTCILHVWYLCNIHVRCFMYYMCNSYMWRIGFPVFFSHKIPGYFQVVSRSKRPLSRLQCRQFWHQRVDAKCVLKLQEYKICKKPFQQNIEMLYILTSRFYPGFLLNLLFCPGFLMFWNKFQAISGPGQIKFQSPGFPGFTGNPGRTHVIQLYSLYMYYMYTTYMYNTCVSDTCVTHMLYTCNT